MTTHISARVSWHDDGWNGRICRKPAGNTYCIGNYSYPGQMIGERRDLEWEKRNAGKACGGLDGIPPCCYSNNAFGLEPTSAYSDPPNWWRDGTRSRLWTLPPATVCIWPYEEMYCDDVRGANNRPDNARRLARATEFFKPIEPDRSLVFYYSNYSNPFSEEESRQYVLTGISRVKNLGEPLFYEGCSDEVRQRYAGGFVWQRSITSHYPDEGLRIPYHAYRDRPEVLERLVLDPDNPRLFKYATRHMTDDDALGLVESFLQVAGVLAEIGDKTEDWAARSRWLNGLVGELWKHRGLLPGMCAVLELLGLHGLIPWFKKQALEGNETEAHEAIQAFLKGKTQGVEGVSLDEEEQRGAHRRWRLRLPAEQALLIQTFPFFAIRVEQLEKILAEERSANGIVASLPEIAANPYIIAEQYQGDHADDFIPWSTIDRGMIPSPELGAERRTTPDGESRLRSLLVESLRREGEHTFMPAQHVLDAVNRRLSVLPEWKRFSFSLRYLNADEEFLSKALHIRSEEDTTYLYLKDVFDDERLLEEKLGFLISGADIQIQRPVTLDTWKSYLFEPRSVLAQKAGADYRLAIDSQAEACQRVFVRPLTVLAGAAGTGKTTVIRALIKAIKKGHGVGTSVIALAPTGKAADRIREVLEGDEAMNGRVEVATIHSFLARRGWLNGNMSFKRSGGKCEDAYSTYILDEASMLDLALAAAFFRSVHWPSVQRLVLVGDPHQLPPIGRGKVFSDVIDFVRGSAPESIATLEHNMRQLLGRVTGGGTGIIDLAQCYVHVAQDGPKDESASIAAERMMRKVQEGDDVDQDLRILYWKDQDDLNSTLLAQVEADMRTDLSREGNDASNEPSELWSDAFDGEPSQMQILSPYRAEFSGVDELNRICQERIQGERPSGSNALGGIMLHDKVIQIRNRPQSWKIAAWNEQTRTTEKIEIYNGQLGFAQPHPFDRDEWQNERFSLKKFRVRFARREQYSVGYGKGLGRNCPDESVEENLELAYAVSVHKAQGSEFERVYVIIPKNRQALLTTEMFYTAITRGRRHCTLLVERDHSPLLAMRRPESAKLKRINSSLFEFRPVPEQLLESRSWMPDGRYHKALAEVMVRSKSEVIIANMLQERDIRFRYEEPLRAPDATFYLPDFTINWRGTDYYWEHLGLLTREDYRAHWEEKREWYERWFKGRLIITEESGDLSLLADRIIRENFV